MYSCIHLLVIVKVTVLADRPDNLCSIPEREQIPESCSLTATQVLWYVRACARGYTHTHSPNKKIFKEIKHFFYYSVTNHLLPLPRVYPSADSDPRPRVYPSADYLEGQSETVWRGEQAPTESLPHGDRLTSTNSSVKARPGWWGER